MHWWGGVIHQVRRAAYTASAVSFFTLVTFLVFRSHELQASPAHHGVWITLPVVDEEPGQIAHAQRGERPNQQRSENNTPTSPAFDQVREAVTTATSSREPPTTGSSHLNLIILENLTGTSVAVGTHEEQQGEPVTAPQVASDSSLFEPQTAYNSLPDSSGSVSPGFRFRGSPYKASSGELALLQRWEVSGEGVSAAAVDGLAFAQSGESEFGGGTFGLSEVPPAFGKEGEWEQDTSLSSDLQLSNSVRVTLDHSYSGSRSQEYENFAAAFVGLSDDWEEDTLNNTAFKVGLWGDRLELTSLHSVSRHDEVTLGDDVVMGQGFFQGLDADLLRGESVSLSVSGSYGIADDTYGSSGDNDDDDDMPGVPGAGTEAMDYGLEAGFALGFADLSLAHERTWETEDLGEDYQNLVSSGYEVGLGFDSLDLMFSYNRSSETEGRGENRVRQTSFGYAAEGEYEVQALRGLLGDPFGATFWDYAPTSISASYGVQQSKGSSGARDETTELGIAASWDWDGGYAGLGYSYSFQDDQQVGSGDNDYRSEGLDIGGGLWGDEWYLDMGLYVSRSAGLGQWNESTELGIDPYIEFYYEPEHWPDLSVSGSTSYYQGDYVSDGGTSMSRYWEVLTELDFAKFWPDVMDSEGEGLKMVFQLTGDTAVDEWDGDTSRDSNLDYFVGFKVDLALGE